LRFEVKFIILIESLRPAKILLNLFTIQSMNKAFSPFTAILFHAAVFAQDLSHHHLEAQLKAQQLALRRSG